MIEILSRSIAHVGGVQVPENTAITRSPEARTSARRRARRPGVARAVSRALLRIGQGFTHLSAVIERPAAVENPGSNA